MQVITGTQKKKKKEVKCDLYFFLVNSYKWSETYSADAYAAFEEARTKYGTKGVRSMGQHYRDTILALGGGTAPKDVWREFRGRENVDVTALLRHSGLSK